MKVEIIYKNGEKITIENVIRWEIDEKMVGFELNDGTETWFRKEDLENVEITDTEFKIGQKVRYIGTEFPDYTGKIYTIEKLYNGGLFSLSAGEKVQLEGAGVWGMSLGARANELEAVEEWENQLY